MIPGEEGARWIASLVLRRNDSILLGPALSEFLLRKDEKPNLEAILSREAERLEVPAGGGGGN